MRMERFRRSPPSLCDYHSGADVLPIHGLSTIL
jgi:hypothetical protein